MAKSLKDILAGVKSSKKEKMNLDDLLMSKEGNAGAKKFIATHEIEKHEDRVGNGNEVYKGKTKKTDFKRQSDGVYEESEESDPAGLQESKITHIVAKSDLDKHKRWMDSEGFDVHTKPLPEDHPKNKTHVGIVSKEPNETAYHEDGWAHRLKESLDEAGAFSYGYKSARKGSVAYNAAKKRKEDEKNYKPIEPKDQMVGTAKVSKKMNEMAMCNHTNEGTYCEAHGNAACPSGEEPKDKPSGNKKILLDKKLKEEYIEEKLTGADPVSKWIHDFVHSDNPKFAGKSKKERIRMALGGAYSAKRGKTRNEQADTTVTFPGKLSATTGGTDLDSTRV